MGALARASWGEAEGVAAGRLAHAGCGSMRMGRRVATSHGTSSPARSLDAQPCMCKACTPNTGLP